MPRFEVLRVLEKNVLNSSKLLLMLIGLVLVAVAGTDVVSAQSAVDYDTDDDGLIEIEWLEQLDAVRWDLDGDGVCGRRWQCGAVCGGVPGCGGGDGVRGGLPGV